MEQITKTYKEFKKARKQSREQALAEEIWTRFGKQKKNGLMSFGRIMAEIKRRGYQWIFEAWQAFKHQPIQEERYFVGILTKVKPELIEIK